MPEDKKDPDDWTDLLAPKQKQDDWTYLLRPKDEAEVVRLEERHFTEPHPIRCKWCGSLDVAKYGSRKGVQEYVCQKCGRKFIDKDAPYKKQTPSELIGTSISSYYDGLSFPEVARHLAESGNAVNQSTVYRWVVSYTEKAIHTLEMLKPKVSNTWVADETAIKFNNRLHWLWDIIDSDTRFLLATYLSPNRGTREARMLMGLASNRAGKVPKVIITDKLAAYLDGIEIPFGAETEHIQSSPFGEDSTSLIERFHGTIKDRTKVIRGFKSLSTASLILNGFTVHYNFFRPHMSLDGKTPAQVAGIRIPFRTWTEFVRQA